MEKNNEICKVFGNIIDIEHLRCEKIKTDAEFENLENLCVFCGKTLDEDWDFENSHRKCE